MSFQFLKINPGLETDLHKSMQKLINIERHVSGKKLKSLTSLIKRER